MPQMSPSADWLAVGDINVLRVCSYAHVNFVILFSETAGDLMRLAIASPGNDFRLGACEAPPAIISTYLGEDMTAYLEAFKSKLIALDTFCC